MTHTAKTAAVARPFVFACFAATLLAGAPAFAGSALQVTDTVKLEYRPAALSTHEGRVEVFKQLTRSVDRTCNRYRTGKIHDMREMRACKKELTASLLEEIGDPRLASLSEPKSRSRIAARQE